MRAPLVIHLCVVNHCGEKATFYLSEPNPDHMATPSPARSSSPPSPLSPRGLCTSSPPSLSSLLLPHPPFICSPPFRLHFPLRKLPPRRLPLADFWKAIVQHVCAPLCVCVCVVGRWGQASLAVSYNQPSRVPVMLCIVRTHH